MLILIYPLIILIVLFLPWFARKVTMSLAFPGVYARERLAERDTCDDSMVEHIVIYNNTLKFIHIKNEHSSKTIIHFHGNLCTIKTIYLLWLEISRACTVNVILVEYPGYLEYQPYINEDMIKQYAEQTYLSLDDRLRDHIVYCHGTSVGTGIAAWLATKYKFKGLMLEYPYTGLMRIVFGHRFIPRFIIDYVDSFITTNLIDSIHCKTHVIVALQDSVIPVEQSMFIYNNLRYHPGNVLTEFDCDHDQLALEDRKMVIGRFIDTNDHVY